MFVIFGSDDVMISPVVVYLLIEFDLYDIVVVHLKDIAMN